MSSPHSSVDDDKYDDDKEEKVDDDVKLDPDDDGGAAGSGSSSPVRPAEQAAEAGRSTQADLEAMNNSDEDDDDEDDDDDDEDEEEETTGRKRPAKKRKTTRHRNRFIEDEAEVDDEDEDLDEEDEDYVRETEEFIDQDAALEADGALDPRRVERDHQRLDRRRREYDDQDAERIAAEFRERHRNQQARAFRGDDENLPQSMLVPSVEDPKLWQLRAKPGREKQLIFSIMRKSLDLEYTEKPLAIFSAFQRDSLPGLIYVEARNRSAVEQAVQGLVGVYVSRGIHLVPIDEMAALLKLTKKRVELVPGSWVRIKRGKYQGDLAQVLDITENGEEVGLKFVPRIDLSPQDEAGPNGKRKKGTMSGALAGRPPQKFFSSEEVAKVHGQRTIVRRGDQFVFAGDTYVDGFIEKDLKVTAVETELVAPTMEELELFSGSGGADGSGAGGAGAADDYTKLQEQARQASMAGLQPGDVVEVTLDQNKGAVGTVVTIAEGIVTLRRTTGENAGAELTVRGEFVKKLFRQGEHVKVMAGKNLDETGLVLKVEGETVTLMSDLSKQEITVFSRDLRVASEVGSGLNAVGQHELHDLIPLSGNNFGVIIRTERDLFHVLDMQSKTTTVRPHMVATAANGGRDSSAYDLNGQTIRKGETVVEAAGDQRSGVVLAIRGLFVFVYNRDIATNEGVFVVSPRALVSSASKTARVATDLTKLNPEIGNVVPAASGVALQGRRFRDPLTDMPVVVVKGINKSRVGIIKDINGEVCRVELQSTNQTVTVNKSALMRKDPRTGAITALPSTAAPSVGVPYRRPASEAPMGPPGTVNPYAGGLSGATPNPYAGDGGRTPAFAAGRTPNAAYGGATPSGAWGFGGATPAAGLAGGRTPAYGMAGGRTPAAGGGIQGGRTPAPHLMGGATPYGAGGGRTPAYGVGGGAVGGGRTPAYGMASSGAAGGRTPAYGGALAGGRTPAYGGGYGGEPAGHGGQGAAGGSGGGQGPWGQSAATPFGAGGSAYQDGPARSGWNAPSNQPYGNAWDAAPTPGAGPQSAPTPGMYGSAPTPGPTPGAAPYSAPTPHDPYSAPTPGAGPYSAPTPAAGGWGN